MQSHGNPIVTHKYTADPTVIEYNGTVYLFTGHDEPPEGIEDYVMNEWLCFSSVDLANWKEHPVPLRAKDFSWAKGDAYASKIIEWKNKFYFYVAISPSALEGKAIGVAVSDRPTGPFTDAKGAPLITNETINE